MRASNEFPQIMRHRQKSNEPYKYEISYDFDNKRNNNNDAIYDAFLDLLENLNNDHSSSKKIVNIDDSHYGITSTHNIDYITDKFEKLLQNNSTGSLYPKDIVIIKEENGCNNIDALFGFRKRQEAEDFIEWFFDS